MFVYVICFHVICDVSYHIVVFTIHPMNETLCLTQSRTVMFSCAANRNGANITTIDWSVSVGGEFQSVQGRSQYVIENSIFSILDMITGALIVNNVSENDNGNQYRCEPTPTEINNVATLTVIGEIII